MKGINKISGIVAIIKKVNMRICRFIVGICMCLLLGSAMANGSPLPKSVTMSRARLLDKIKGGWAGQTIGVSFGSYTEFRYQGTFIQDYQTIPWDKGYVQELMDSWPDLYDDIYMDLTFVDVFEKKRAGCFGKRFCSCIC